MTSLRSLIDLEQRGAMSWQATEQAWVACPEDIVNALAEEGFQEYKRETATEGHGTRPAGGMWQGLDPRSGDVATVIWVTRTPPQRTRSFIEVAGLPLEADDRGAPMMGTWWTGIDSAVLACLARGGRLSPAEIAQEIGLSDDAVQSVLTMLADQHKIQIASVELSHV